MLNLETIYHMSWCVCHYERTLKLFNDFHTHAKNKINSLKISQPRIPSKEACASFCLSKTKHATKRHKQNEGKPSSKTATVFKP